MMIFAMRHYDLWLQYNPDKASVFFWLGQFLATVDFYHSNWGLDFSEYEFRFFVGVAVNNFYSTQIWIVI